MIDLARIDTQTLERLHAEISAEINARLIEKFQHGGLPPLNGNERDAVRNGRRTEAIRSYRGRTGSSLRVCMVVTRDYLEEISK